MLTYYYFCSITIKTEPLDAGVGLQPPQPPPPAKTPTPDSVVVAASVIQEPPTKLIKLEIPSIIDDDNHIDVDDVADIDVDVDITTNATNKANSFFYDKSALSTPSAVAALPPPPPPRPLSASSPSSATDTKYCHICDIKFNYLNTFMAHKQFYCVNKTTDMDVGNVVPASNAGAGPRTSPSVAATVGRAETSVL